MHRLRTHSAPCIHNIVPESSVRQAATSSGKPVLLRVDYDAGHGVGSTRNQHDLEFADEMSFLLWQFGDPDFQPPK